MYELWMQWPNEDDSASGIDRFVGTVESHMRANAMARNLIEITGNNVWVEEI